MTAARPYDPKSLAEKWGVSATTIRNRCDAGELPHFRLGKLYRIPAKIVEEIESCQTSASDDLEAVSASTGALREDESVISLRHAPERKPRQKQ